MVPSIFFGSLEMKKLIAIALLTFCGAAGAKDIWAPYDGQSGISCESWNHGYGMQWKTKGGDWIDANGVYRGTTPFSTAKVNATTQVGATVSWDVTGVIQGGAPFIMLRGTPTSIGAAQLGLRENVDPTARPVLKITRVDGSVTSEGPIADAEINCSTVEPLGLSPTISMGAQRSVILTFPSVPDAVKAVLEMKVTGWFSANVTVEAYRVQVPRGADQPVTTGLSVFFPNDIGIGSHPDVIYAESWDGDANYLTHWNERTYGPPRLATGWDYCKQGTVGMFNSEKQYMCIAPGVQGNGLVAHIRTDTLGGTAPASTFLPNHPKFKLPVGTREPDEMYLRYYVKFGASVALDPLCKSQGGKLPGIMGDITIAGNGGVKVNGTNGWSMRQGYEMPCDVNNPAYPGVLLSTYAYHALMAGLYGDGWVYTQYGDDGVLMPEKWVCLEQHVKVNTPGVQDGLVEAWVDGKLVFRKDNAYMRALPPYVIPAQSAAKEPWWEPSTYKLGIRTVNYAMHHGGKTPPTVAFDIFTDQTVAATSRIGCMPDGITPPPAPTLASLITDLINAVNALPASDAGDVAKINSIITAIKGMLP